ncbi:hypothetical protein [Halobacillus ihumii]|uniref:hypothetical protein n=1 Tax=Halobacillus ihumii TaxID=2686092 RepID=UPI0013CF86F4|nr:hypothetical protein [Halobacillus ihumii]
MTRVLTWIVIVFSMGTLLYRYRYKAFDVLSTVPYLRHWLIQQTMSMPYVRRKVLSNMFK